MFEYLDEIIVFLQNKHSDINLEWAMSNDYQRINYKKHLVKDIYTNNMILDSILNYRSFLNTKNAELILELKEFSNNNIINARVKSQNSIEYKVENYIKNHNNGEGPINKCFNDLFGARIIFEEDIEFERIKNFIDSKYPKLKCIDSSKKEYVATHIYFKSDNYNLQWELQIWDKKHEMSNLVSHDKYKQEYSKWEMENKEVNQFDNTLYNNE